MISAGGWDGDLIAEARLQFGEIMAAALNGGEAPQAASEPEEPGPRAPRPNHHQGTSEGATRPLSPAEMFAEMLTGVPYSDRNQLPGKGRMSAAETGQHAGWRKLHEGY